VGPNRRSFHSFAGRATHTMGPMPAPRSCSNRPRPRQLRARSIGEPDCACVARILPHVRFAAVKARPNMGRDRRTFRSFRPAATRTMRQRSAPRSCSNRPSRDSYGRDPSVSRLRMSSRRVLPPSNVAAKARPSRWRSSIISFIPRGGNAHYPSEVCPAFMLQSTEPRQLRARSIGGPFAHVVAPSIAAQQRRGESTPK
jgi:hypothetical protein